MVSYLDQGGVQHLVDKLLDRMYPVNSIYISTNSTSPASLYGGSWERYGTGRVLVSASDSDTDFTAGKTGGKKNYNAATETDLGVSIAVDSNAVILFNQSDTHHTAASFRCGGSMNTGHGINWSDRSVRNGQKVYGTLPAVQPYVAVYIWRRTA